MSSLQLWQETMSSFKQRRALAKACVFNCLQLLIMEVSYLLNLPLQLYLTSSSHYCRISPSGFDGMQPSQAVIDDESGC